MKSAGFIAAAAVATALASYSLEKYRGLGRRMPITAIAFTISLLALAGVPPLNGFWSKLVLFGAAINSGPLVTSSDILTLMAGLGRLARSQLDLDNLGDLRHRRACAIGEHLDPARATTQTEPQDLGLCPRFGQGWVWMLTDCSHRCQE